MMLLHRLESDAPEGEQEAGLTLLEVFSLALALINFNIHSIGACLEP